MTIAIISTIRRQIIRKAFLIKKIRQEDGYKMPIATLTTMCFFREIKLSDFFKRLEDKYGVKLNDDILRDN